MSISWQPIPNTVPKDRSNSTFTFHNHPSPERTTHWLLKAPSKLNEPPFCDMSHKQDSLMRLSIGAATLILALATAKAEPAASPNSQNLPVLPAPRDYSFGFFPQGWRRDKVDESTKDLLRLETGYYGFEIDADDIQNPRFGLLNDGLTARQALASGLSRTASLAPAKLTIEINKDGKIYRAVCSQAGTRADAKRMEDIRLWESGRFVQHYELYNLEFADEQGNLLGGNSNLRMIGWPDSLTLTAEITPSPNYTQGPVAGVSGAGLAIDKSGLEIPHTEAIDPAHFTLEAWFKLPEQWMFPERFAWIATKNKNMNTDGFFGLLVEGDRPAAILNIGGNKENRFWLSTSYPLAKGKWHHLALTYDGQKACLYVNGKPAKSMDIGRERAAGKDSLLIGKDGTPTAVSRSFVDDVRLWSRVLPPGEIAARKAKPNAPASPEGLVYEETFGSQSPPKEVWKNAEISIAFQGGGRDWKTSQKIPGDWPEGIMKSFSLPCDVVSKRLPTEDVTVRLLNQDFKVAYNPAYNCQFAPILRPKRTWKMEGNTCDFREYDDFLIEVENKGTTPGNVPFVLNLLTPLGITGIHPTLCHEDGRPTGIHVQNGKNWHSSPAYFRGYTYLPAPVGTSRYVLRLSYGFYGTLPQATHAQLSLVGHGGNGRWDQIAIGAWGETQCLDMDHSLANNFVTDNRGMLVRNGANGPLWQWVEAGWGGDWLSVNNAAGQKLDSIGFKAYYAAHGPCLSEVEYSGQLGRKREVKVQSTVHVPRSDDYVRTLVSNTYEFQTALPTSGSWLFKVGNSHNYSTPRVCYGNREGLLGEQLPLPGAKKGDTPLDCLELTGAGPWWIAFPESKVHLPPGRKHFGTAAKALIVRSYKATFGGKVVSQPSISLVVNGVHPDGRLDYTALLTPPAGLTDYQPGDKVELDVEWITVPHNAVDYYGPNEALRKHLAESPGSWKTIHREALGNDLFVTATGATVLSNYPVIAHIEEPLAALDPLWKFFHQTLGVAASEAAPEWIRRLFPFQTTLNIRGGVGHVPIRFDGLKSVDGFKLYEIVNGKPIELNQAAKGNDFWQTDHDSTTNTYRVSYNIPLDGKPTSRWVFKKAE